MANIFRDEDADLVHLEGRTVAILGYGNQGRGQALNLRDSGVNVIVGSPSDHSAQVAREDDFDVYSMGEATERADIVFLLVPDEVMPGIYRDAVEPNLRDAGVLNFAHGFNIFYGFIKPKPAYDVTLLGPRMIGKGVRETFERGIGFPSLVAVEQDASGNAWPTLLALAKGIGSTRMGAVQSTFKEETCVDLFSEQSGDLVLLRSMFEVLSEMGVDPDVAILELYGSGELAEMYAAARDMGMWGQLRLHSRTSQYGQQVVAPRHTDAEAIRKSLRDVYAEIADGSFAKEWNREWEQGLPTLHAANEESLRHPMQHAEDHLYRELGRRTESLSNPLDDAEVTSEPLAGETVSHRGS
jgi:ketol-acid reductoisomerase